eukprot:gb/GFBE01075769.1/.p1 GENE.gb/GFBE01075769.1/~~gb/GFBE01075769.1/.p1  ORF type:complete len:189 (+),score=41.47 gb/GFBE01075769.1/:1-567(+)
MPIFELAAASLLMAGARLGADPPAGAAEAVKGGSELSTAATEEARESMENQATEELGATERAGGNASHEEVGGFWGPSRESCAPEVHEHETQEECDGSAWVVLEKDGCVAEELTSATAKDELACHGAVDVGNSRVLGAQEFLPGLWELVDGSPTPPSPRASSITPLGTACAKSLIPSVEKLSMALART